MIGYAFCGSFCTMQRSIKVLRSLCAEGNRVLPIVSDSVYTTDTRFGTAEENVKKIEQICGMPVVHSIVGAEPIGNTLRLDMLVISPCTGNTLAKIAGGITDSTVTMAAKAQLRSDRPVVIALATNDALSANLENIGVLLKRKNVFFVPLGQDDPKNKPHSLVCDFDMIPVTMMSAFAGRQIQPILTSPALTV
ncbi:MAG: dipicolinate synthase subunit B [Clostridia bacterium]|nr:dipicolinate synthase subunit B [Clostridia bacterium]